MTEQVAVQDPIAQPEVKEYRYEYQPEDNGLALGGKQVIVYDGTPEDLGKKMAAQNSELIKLNRRINKELRLSSAVKDTIPDTAPRFDESKYELKPEPLTAEERIQLAQDIVDPEKFEAASKRLIRAQFGDPDAMRTRMARMEQRLDRATVQEEALAFKRSNPDYFPTQGNLETLGAWMLKNNLDPIKENFQLAYDTLKEYLEARPAAIVPPPPAPVADPKPAAVVDTRPVSSGLTRTHGSDNGPAPKTGYSQKEIDAMSAEDYKRLVLYPEFKAKQGRQ